MAKRSTIHTHRTIMFKELEKVMDYAISDDSYFQALDNNVTGKKSADGIKQTARFLKIIYGFDQSNASFKFFKFFWTSIDMMDRELITFLFALNNDYLLSESISVIANTKIGEKTTVVSFEENIEKYYPNKYSTITRHSIGKNLASSWKQAGFIIGKVKNIRTQPDVSYNCVAFAFIMAYLNGLRGDFIISSKWVKALCLNENQLRELAIEASKRGLIQYQFSGNVTSITCNELLKKLEINDI
ncbi:MAG: hypothetical protein H7Z76_08930 [Methylotenera sp.]|nr:hypothetical protein [Flavobacterium sp.]